MLKKIVFTLSLFTSFLFADYKSLDEALIEAKKQEKDLLLFIHSKHCFYCKDMIKNTLNDEEVKEFIEKRFIFLMVEDYQRNLLRKDIKTNFVPMTYLISGEDGEILLELPGRKDKKTFISIIKDTLLE